MTSRFTPPWNSPLTIHRLSYPSNATPAGLSQILASPREPYPQPETHPQRLHVGGGIARNQHLVRRAHPARDRTTASRGQDVAGPGPRCRQRFKRPFSASRDPCHASRTREMQYSKASPKKRARNQGPGSQRHPHRLLPLRHDERVRK